MRKVSHEAIVSNHRWPCTYCRSRSGTGGRRRTCGSVLRPLLGAQRTAAVRKWTGTARPVVPAGSQQGFSRYRFTAGVVKTPCSQPFHARASLPRQSLHPSGDSLRGFGSTAIPMADASRSGIATRVARLAAEAAFRGHPRRAYRLAPLPGELWVATLEAGPLAPPPCAQSVPKRRAFRFRNEREPSPPRRPKVLHHGHFRTPTATRRQTP
jgi:hypothetical protein